GCHGAVSGYHYVPDAAPVAARAGCNRSFAWAIGFSAGRGQYPGQAARPCLQTHGTSTRRVRCASPPTARTMHGLNPQQSAAVAHVEGPLLVLAGAGSGKTRVIVEKIAHLVATRRYPARRIAAITFTNKAAKEMRERVGKRIRGDDAEGLVICTFHALGLRMLQVEHAKAGLRRGFSIFDADDTASQLKDLLPGAKPDAVQAAQALVSRAKNAGLSPEQALEAAQSAREREAAALYARYQARLAAVNAVDLDDLARLPVQLMENDADVALG